MEAVSCLMKQLERNKRLKTEINDLHSNIDALRGYSQGFKLETNLCKQQRQLDITSSLMSLTAINGTSTTSSQVDIDELDRDLRHDDIFIPTVHCPSSIKTTCPGCGQQFQKYGSSYESAYYIHCIKECKDYQNLGRIKRCTGCSKYFINSTSLTKHNCNAPSRPSWMPPAVYINGVANHHFKDARCPGCHVLYKNATNSHNYSIQFVFHVIEECEEYKKLDLIKECFDCGYKFMNTSGYKIHRWTVHNPNQCHVCDIDFVTAFRLRRHMKCHLDVRPFKCASCAATFKRKDTLNRHMMRKICSTNQKRNCNR